ncbi:hypothetical protein AVEN_260205-1 [Araneus ventricosus]|uniref:Uncharacterized protein n=1 Tax=Araneus ventricosus TaxID=182803 RepID=A0A4Y2PZI5_ARAVE|nr:hypothetical protein AVEN_260205-1 [Araneus ventricosus]
MFQFIPFVPTTGLYSLIQSIDLGTSFTDVPLSICTNNWFCIPLIPVMDLGVTRMFQFIPFVPTTDLYSSFQSIDLGTSFTDVPIYSGFVPTTGLYYIPVHRFRLSHSRMFQFYSICASNFGLYSHSFQSIGDTSFTDV